MFCTGFHSREESLSSVVDSHYTYPGKTDEALQCSVNIYKEIWSECKCHNYLIAGTQYQNFTTHVL